MKNKNKNEKNENEKAKTFLAPRAATAASPGQVIPRLGGPRPRSPGRQAPRSQVGRRGDRDRGPDLLFAVAAVLSSGRNASGGRRHDPSCEQRRRQLQRAVPDLQGDDPRRGGLGGPQRAQQMDEAPPAVDAADEGERGSRGGQRGRSGGIFLLADSFPGLGGRRQRDDRAVQRPQRVLEAARGPFAQELESVLL